MLWVSLGLSIKTLRLKVELVGYDTGIWEFPKIGGTLFWGPDNKDPTI